MNRKSSIVRTRNNNTMSDSEFFSFLRSGLRKLSLRGWKPISQVRLEARIPYIGPNKKRKYSYICSQCKGEFDAKSCAVDHIYPSGSLKSFEDLAGFCERLFTEKQNLQLLCSNCHQKKTNLERAS